MSGMGPATGVGQKWLWGSPCVWDNWEQQQKESATALLYPHESAPVHNGIVDWPSSFEYLISKVQACEWEWQGETLLVQTEENAVVDHMLSSIIFQ